MNQELTTIEKIRSLLLAYGVPNDIEIEEEAEGMILAALNQDDIASVGIDEEGGLVIEFNGNE
jgi:hypothetical protein